ncbi:MAG: hypothetical protein MZV65_42010 [Chromatiales bacterium]|nr:hypothetical protein [Chromatiales bacterium]
MNRCLSVTAPSSGSISLAFPIAIVPSAIVRHALYICMALAGPISESILEGEDPPYWFESNSWWTGSPDDVSSAESFARLLPFRNEQEHAIDVTTAALVEHWDRVIRVADAPGAGPGSWRMS